MLILTSKFDTNIQCILKCNQNRRVLFSDNVTTLSLEVIYENSGDMKKYKLLLGCFKMFTAYLRGLLDAVKLSRLSLHFLGGLPPC